MLFCFQAGGTAGQPTQKYVILCFRVWYQQGRVTGLGYDVNKWIRGVRWQAWNGTSCRRAVRIVQEKVRFHRDYWSTAAGACCSPAGFQGRPTNPFLCSYHWQISSSLCVCGRGGSVYVCVRCSGALLRQRVEYSPHFGLSTVARLPDMTLLGREVKWEVGQGTEQRPMWHMTTAALQLIIKWKE